MIWMPDIRNQSHQDYTCDVNKSLMKEPSSIVYSTLSFCYILEAYICVGSVIIDLFTLETKSKIQKLRLHKLQY